ncbi:MAG: Asp-tRNA(Asn)/Glu-tRNA(Gln) amidotransferase subunit GatB [Spirochaetales bacterium]|nr:Asp-tRNA(Asn)/Glu-tRNA(Gln) amidotransferase subunit GatB [Spirochaetales bacterium]
MKYDVVIGCEVHVQLATKSKMFCSCPNKFGGEPNTRVCPVCLGLPGSLPVPNSAALEMAVKAGLALGCSIAPITKFDRKNYMYPDLPKAYQISQYDIPIAVDGKLSVRTGEGEREVRIIRAHLEEDAGKNVHALGADGRSGVDYNRAGTPLLEIVSEPDLRSPAEAAAYVASIREIVRALDVSDGNMEEGSLRCDANINLWVYEGGVKHATPIVELKNMNSFKSIRQALEYEVERQADEWREARLTMEKGSKRTRGWNEERGVTVLLRVKEEEADYRYFPEPDIRPIALDREYVEGLRSSLAELPEARRERYRKLGISAQDAEGLAASSVLAFYFESVVEEQADAKKAASWIMGEVRKYLNEKGLADEDYPVKAPALARLLALIEQGTISNTQAKVVLVAMADSGKSADDIVREQGLAQISGEAALLEFVEKALIENPDSAANYRAGKEKALGHLMGQVMKLSRGKANPQEVEKLLKKRLSE